MLNIVFARVSAPSARLIAEQSDEITISQSSEGDVNWGRATAHTTLNPDLSNATNKRVMRELFRDNGVPMPRLFTEDEAFGEVVVGQTILGRPDRHMKGRGFWKVSNLDEYDRALRGTRKKRAATHFMEFIDSERAPLEFRAHVFRGKSIRISEKAHTEFHKYTTIRPSIDDLSHIRSAAKKAVAAVGLDFGAVDILANDEEAWVLEVNTAPGLGGSMPRVYAETFLAWQRGEF